MWSRRDQIQAYQFLRRRTVSAILLGDANHPQSPTRRAVIALIVGSIALLLIMAGFGIYGLFRKGGSKAWQREAAILVEKESGARYIRDSDGLLRPVVNYASARLITGTKGTLVRISRNSLSEVPRGPAVGIPGAPDSLPSAKGLVNDPWTACSTSSSLAGPAQTPRLTLLVGPAQWASERFDLGKGAGLVVQSQGAIWVVTDGRRFRVRERNATAVLRSLDLGEAPRTVVSPGWLGTVPAGPDLRYPKVTGRGESSSAVDGADLRVGQVVVEKIAGSSTGRYLLVQRDGLSPLSVIQARLVLGDPASRTAYPRGTAVAEVPITPAQRATAKVSATDLDPGSYPSTAPEPLIYQTGTDVVVCATPEGFRSEVPAMTVSVGFGATPTTPGGRPVAIAPLGGGGAGGSAGGGGESGGSGVLADTVVITPGRGALVRSAPAQRANGPVYLVTDQGQRFAVTSTEAQTALGFGGVRPQVVPSVLVDLLGTGPALDRQAATAVVAAPPPGGSAPGASPAAASPERSSPGASP
ncbi:MAG: type VII secretion protein EccB [Angustibacter sp.]